CEGVPAATPVRVANTLKPSGRGTSETVSQDCESAPLPPPDGTRTIYGTSAVVGAPSNTFANPKSVILRTSSPSSFAIRQFAALLTVPKASRGVVLRSFVMESIRLLLWLQAPQHVVDRADLYHRRARLRQLLIVLAQPPVAPQPGE